MNFEELVEYIKLQGCKVRIYRDRSKVHNNTGTFHISENGPLISLAVKGSPKRKRAEYLLHEFGHFLQWKDGYMDTLDAICDSYSVFEEWVAGEVELTEMEWTAARNMMLAMEWDAEERALELGKQLEVKYFDPEHHLKGANAYILALKWAWDNRKDFNSAPRRSKMQPRVLTKKELFAPISKKEKRILRGYRG